MQLKLIDIKKVLILGSGTLGLRIGLQAAISGFNSTLYDINETAFAPAQKIQDTILKNLVEKKLISPEDAAAAKSRITFTTDPVKAAADADFVSESVLENLEVKKKVWAQFAKLCPPHTVFTTNTSYLMPSLFAAETGRPERFCAFHFHDVFIANVVDIMPHPGTSPWVVDLLMELGRKLNQTPVFVKKESPGYIFNAMLVALIGAAGALVTYDIASIEDVDRSWMGNFKMERGPFGILDLIGLETVWHVTHSLPDAKSKKFADLLKTYVDAGKLGVKTGEGFYTYPNPRFQEINFITGAV
ncbi:MAG: 3-hydroxyacyl-CoA dehydrogenase [Chitinophagaceae bacterium]